ncbi:MAG: NAD(+) synthase [Tissierellia bacterium]|nr:NAD(+) synthase [Tissierellia bacterium]
MINEQTISELVSWLKDSVNNAGAKGIVFGLSGGIDSAVLAGISKLAFPNTTLGIIMPSHSNPNDEVDGLSVAECFEIKTEKVDLTSVYDTLIDSSFDSSNDMAKSNIKPRLRMTTLYYYAQSNNYLVCSGSNKSEFYLGYFTKHGDSGTDLLPLIDFTKSEIYELARLLKVPAQIIEKPPSAGLWEGQTDEDEMGFSYKVLEDYFDGREVPEKIRNKIENMHRISEHKRNYPNAYKRI